MGRRSGADRSQVQVANGAFGHGTHRVVDPGDPPRDLSGWAWGVYVSFGLMALLSLGRLMAALNLRSTVTGSGDLIGDYDAYSTWMGFQTMLLLIAAGVFITWFFQAYKNLRRLGVQNMRWGNGWAVGAWFVPILGLWRPKQIANDIWRGSERGTEVHAGWKQVPVPGFVHWWWGLFIAQGLITYAGQETTRSGYEDIVTRGLIDSGITQIKTGTTIDVIGDLIGIVGLVLAIAFVSRVTNRFAEIGGEALAHASVYPQQPQPQYTQPQPPYPQPQSYPPPSALAAAPPAAVSTPPPPAPAEPLIRCPECAEWIQPQANVCRYCGYRLRPLGP